MVRGESEVAEGVGRKRKRGRRTLQERVIKGIEKGTIKLGEILAKETTKIAGEFYRPLYKKMLLGVKANIERAVSGMPDD